MGAGEFSEMLPPGARQPPGDVMRLLLELEANGWKPRKLIAARAIAYWPDGHRSRQIRVDLYHPIVEQKLKFYREHTQLQLLESEDMKEEG